MPEYEVPLGLSLKFVKQHNLTKVQELIMLTLMHMHTTSETDLVSPSIEVIAKLAGCSGRTVNRQLNELCKKNVLIRKNNRVDNLIVRNQYEVIGWKSFIEAHTPKE